VGVLVSLAALAGVLVTLFGGYLFVLHCSSGDGGAPYVASDSTQADVCGATGDGSVVLLLCLVAVAAGCALAYRAGRAWIAGDGPGARFGAFVAIPAVIPILLLAIANIPSDDCEGAARAAYEAWVEGGRAGEQPYDCETY